MTACPSDEELTALAEERLDAAGRRRVSEHLESCAACRLLVDALMLSPEPGLEAGTRVGRFVVLGRVGIGGMGAVYAAYDPELDRKVALKLVRPEMREPQLEARLKREAQALARLSHPEVIAVYDVGTFDDGVFIAMEFIDGGTLRSWIEAAPRSWREIVDRFIRAGEGLAAAHDAGLVHRDFKPDNILIGRDGRQRVTDFGLVRALASAEEHETPAPPSPNLPLHATLTRPGAVVGTPAFIAPEQLEHPADARSDQFSFCASLYQCLYDELPFAGERLADYVAAAQQQRLRPAPRSTRVPSRVRAVLVRGLKANPDERYPSLRALLTALRATRRRRFAPVVATAALLLLSAGAVSQRLWMQRQLSCHAEQHLAGVWDDARKHELHAAFTRTGAPFAEDAWTATARALDGYVARWVAMRTDACQATQLRHEQPEHVMQLRYSCLDDRLNETQALVDTLAHADTQLLARAPEASASLSSLTPCANVRALTARTPYRDEAQAAAVAAVTKDVDAARALFLAGKSKEAEAALVKLEERERAIGYAPALARTRFYLAEAERALGRFAEAESAAEEAGFDSLLGRDDEALEYAWALLVEVVGADRHQLAGAKWRRYAEAVESRRGAVPDELSAYLLSSEATFLQAHDQFDEAETVLTRERAIYERLPERRAQALQARSSLIVNMCEEGRIDAALPLQQALVADYRALLGPLHPRTLATAFNVGVSLQLLRRYGEALEAFDASLAAYKQVSGEHHTNVAVMMMCKADALLGLGRAAEAEALAQRAMPLMLEFVAPDEPGMYLMVATLGRCALAQGRRDEGLRQLERAVAMAERGGVSAIESAPTRFTLARALVDAGRDRPRARSLAIGARDTYRAQAARWGGINGARADEIDQWLTTQH
jgi:tetratricopeptide (TPR) repeat protein